MIDRYEIRRRYDDLRYRLSGLPRRTLITVLLIALLTPLLLLVIGYAVVASSDTSAATDSKVRERHRQAIRSEEAKADTAKLVGMNESEFAAELEHRRAAWREVEKAGGQSAESGEKAWGALLRAEQVEAERRRHKPKSEGRSEPKSDAKTDK